MNRIYRHAPEMITRVIAGEMILVPVRQTVEEMGNIYTLNETGVRIWELLDGERSLAQVKEQIMNEFDVPASQVEEDMLELIQNLLEQGALLEVKDGIN